MTPQTRSELRRLVADGRFGGLAWPRAGRYVAAQLVSAVLDTAFTNTSGPRLVRAGGLERSAPTDLAAVSVGYTRLRLPSRLAPRGRPRTAV